MDILVLLGSFTLLKTPRIVLEPRNRFGIAFLSWVSANNTRQ